MISMFGKNRFKNLSAEYVEESLKLATEVADTTDISDIEIENKQPVAEVADTTDISDIEIENIDESAYIDALLEALS